MEEKPDSAQRLRTELEKRVMVLDGAMGTRLMALKPAPEAYPPDNKIGFPADQTGNLDLLTLTRPEFVADIHRSYLRAGADIICTNTFCSNAVDQTRFGTKSMVRQLNLEAVRLARRVTDEYADTTGRRTRFVAGVMGPTRRSVSRPPGIDTGGFAHIDFEELRGIYVQSASALVEGGADMLLVESVYDLQNLGAALAAIDEVRVQSGAATPIWVSLTLADESGRLLSGETVDEVWRAVRSAGLFCIGLNCSSGPGALKPHLERLAASVDIAVSVHPSAGLPDRVGRYDETPQTFADTVSEYTSSGSVNIVGGCCGTTERHIRALARAVLNFAPRPFKQ